MGTTRIGIAAIWSVLITTGSWTGQDPPTRVLTSNDIKAEIGTDADARSVVAQVLTHLIFGHDRREFFLASQIRTEWLPSTPGVEVVRLANAEIVGHISGCGQYWLGEKVERVDNVVSMRLKRKCGGTVLDYIVSFEESQWRLGPPGTGKNGGGWVPGIGSGFVGGPPPGCRCQSQPTSFSQRIPAADPEKYRFIRDAKDWTNPYLIVKSDTIEVIAKAISSGREIVTLGGLREALVNLPLAAWPYGRVVAIQPQGFGSPLDRTPIVRNVQAVKTLLEELPVLVDPWPP